MREYFQSILQTVQASVESMDNAQFARLAEMCRQTLDAGHKLIVSGLGKNVSVCEKFVGTMNSLGMRACFMNTNSAVHGDLGMVEQGDLVILLTKSGETVESVYLTSLLKRRDVTIWLLSFREESTLSREIQNRLILKLAHEGDPWNIVPNNSTTVNLIVLQGLAMTLAGQRGITLEQFKRNHPGGFIGEQLKNA